MVLEVKIICVLVTMSPVRIMSVNLRSWADELKDNDKVLDRPWSVKGVQSDMTSVTFVR